MFWLNFFSGCTLDGEFVPIPIEPTKPLTKTNMECGFRFAPCTSVFGSALQNHGFEAPTCDVVVVRPESIEEQLDSKYTTKPDGKASFHPFLNMPRAPSLGFVALAGFFVGPLKLEALGPLYTLQTTNKLSLATMRSKPPNNNACQCNPQNHDHRIQLVRKPNFLYMMRHGRPCQ